MSAFTDFLKKNVAKNAGDIPGAIGIGGSLIELATTENKLKAVKNLVFNLIAATFVWDVAMTKTFAGAKKGLNSLLHDTGSLDQMFRKLGQIQGFQRIFEPLVGGAEAARKKVAELVNFAASRNLKFEDVANAAHSMEALTRGAFSGTRALQIIGDRAASSGNNIKDVATVVSDFYGTLRNGEPIESSTEEMRQMGVISAGTEEQLNRLREAGAGTTPVFEALTAAMESSRGGMQSTAGDLQQVNQAFRQARESLQEKFASPFGDKEVQNTKNWTQALIAITPVVASISAALAILFNGMASLTSRIAEAAAKSQVFQFAIKMAAGAITLLVAGLTVLGSIGVVDFLMGAAAWMGGFAVACISAGGAVATLTGVVAGLGAALAALAALTVVLALFGTIVAGIISYHNAVKQTTEELHRLRQAHEQVNEAMQAQIDSITTLTDKHEALQKAIQNSADAHRQYMESLGTGKKDQIAENARQVEKTKAALTAASAAPTEPPTEYARGMVEKAEAIHQTAYENATANASPANKVKLEEAQMVYLSKRASRGESEKRGQEQFRQQSSGIDSKLAQYQLEQQNALTDAALFSPGGNAYQNAVGAYGQSKGSAVSMAAAKRAKKHADDMALEISRIQAQRNQLGLKSSSKGVQSESEISQIQAALTYQTLHDQYQTAKQGAAPKEEQLGELKRQMESQKILGGNLINRPRSALLAAQQGATIKSEVARHLADTAIQNRTGAMQIANQTKIENRELSIAERRAQVEKEIAETKGRGEERAFSIARQRLALLDEEIQRERNRGANADQAKINQLLGERAGIVRETGESLEETETSRAGARRELSEQSARLSGNSGQLQKLKDMNLFAENLGRGKSLFGNDADARKYAVTSTANSIRLSGTEGQLSFMGQAHASSLARIGGGGGVEQAHPNSLISINRRIAELNAQEVMYLKQLAASKALIN